MMKFASVIYNYSPKNEDELELKEGDEIEVLGYEEEGWWKGKLRGRTGVFPSNFVKVVEGVASSHGSQPAPASNQSSGLTPGNKLMNFLAKNSKTSPSSNSLNSNNSNSTSGNNNNNNNSYQNRIMNNTVQQQHPQQQGGSPSTPAVVGEDPAASERRPKPIRGVGYGDIFAAGAKPKLPPGSDIAGHTSNVDRLSSSLVNSLKHIPKKPPPPAPATTTDDNSGGSTNQAPALPPKPSPHFPHSKPYPPPPATTSLPPVTTTNATSVQQLARREPARSIHAHEKSNDDELALGAGGVIETIDKGLEDRGWWKSNLIN